MSQRWMLCCAVALACTVAAGCKSGGEAAGGIGGDGGSGGIGGDGGSGGSTALPFEGEVGNLVEALRSADFVFEGEVIAIEYANATNNGTGGPDPDADDTPDSGELPHTFVTYSIMEDFSGNGAGETVTMRFLGGVDESSGPDYDIYELAQSPQFDMGDRDIVFMRRNTVNACPIVDCANGRFRLVQSPNDDRPYVFTELGQEVRVMEDSPSEGRLFVIGEHEIPDINEQTIVFPDGTSAELMMVSIDEQVEQDTPATRIAKHSFDPNADGTSPEDGPGQAFGAPVAGIRIEPDGFRALVRKAIADHPDFAWLPYANADPDEPFQVPMFEDVPGPANDDDPRVMPPERTPYEDAEAAAAEAFGINAADVVLPLPDAADIAARRQTLTGVVEAPNEEDETSAAEDMWTGRTR